MIPPKMLPGSASAPTLELCIHRTWPGRDLAPIARFRTIRRFRAESMSVSCGSPSRGISMTVASSSERSFSSPIMAEEGIRGEVSVSESSRFATRVAKTELRDESVMEEVEFERFEMASVEAKAPDVLVGSGGGGDDGGKNWFGDGYGDSGRGSGSMDEYYQKMIEAYPCDALILSNYARFLKEVKGDLVKAEEYCERAILAKSNDGNALSLYGDLIWQIHGDGDRAQTYFDQAVHSAPNDCYVLGSYAKFLWDAGDEDEDEDDEVEINTHPSHQKPSEPFRDQNQSTILKSV